MRFSPSPGAMAHPPPPPRRGVGGSGNSRTGEPWDTSYWADRITPVEPDDPDYADPA